jgi:glycosyltransferase involved in cell wall biosynthesis
MAGEALGQSGQLNIAQPVTGRNLYLGVGPFLLVWQMGVMNWLEHWHPDVLIMEANPRNASSNTALRWMHARGRPVIGWGLGAPPLRGPLPGLFGQSRRHFLSSFDALISYSRTGAEQFADAGFPAERIFVAPNAATSIPAHALPDRPPLFRDGKPVVLFVGRLQPRKRVDALIRACAALPKEIQPRLLVVGDGPVRAELEALADEIYPTVEFTGEKRDKDLEPYYRAADLFALPGTGGLAVQQAMSFGLPVMVAEADGTQADLVRPGNGWLLSPADQPALQAQLADALSDPSRLRRMGAESYRIVAEEVNLERMVGVFAEVISKVKRVI